MVKLTERWVSGHLEPFAEILDFKESEPIGAMRIELLILEEFDEFISRKILQIVRGNYRIIFLNLFQIQRNPR
jgi:hypothetical protein